MLFQRLASMNGYLLRLYAYAREANPALYSQFVIDGLCEQMQSEKAWWGVLSRLNGVFNLDCSLKTGLSDSWEANWHLVRQDDIIAKAISAERNRCQFIDNAGLPRDHGLWSLIEPDDVRLCLSRSIDLPKSSAFMCASVYRGWRDPPFTAVDRQVFDFLVPHLYNAWEQNLRDHLHPYDRDRNPTVSRAFIDRDGRLIRFEDDFIRPLANHYRNWRGNVLPTQIWDAARRSMAQSGGWVEVGSWKIRLYPAGLLHLIELREHSELDRLSPRQFEVARLFGEGATYKEIAARMTLSPTTVRSYIREIYSHLAIDNKASLAAMLVSNGEMR